MHSTARLSFQPFSRFAAPLRQLSPARGSIIVPLLAAALSAGCTLISDVDRSKIPAAEVLPPDPPPPGDAGGEEPAPAEGDAGGEPQGDAGTLPEPDAGGEPQPDAGDGG